MSASRQKILTHLKKTRSASVREIARALKLSAPNVRHHLTVLRSDGRVEMTSVKDREGRGRPEKVFSLSEAALGDNLPALVHALLAATGSKVDLEAAAGFILDDSEFAGLSMNKRLPLLIEKLNAMHYQSHWEAGAGGPRIIFGRCPYGQVVELHPEICKMDAALIAKVLGRDVSIARKQDVSVRGVCPLLFQLK